jgi:hypothetical protein
MAFVPLVLLAATKLIKGKSKRESRRTLRDSRGVAASSVEEH